MLTVVPWNYPAVSRAAVDTAKMARCARGLRAFTTCLRRERGKEAPITEEQQLDVLRCLDAILLEILLDLLAACYSSAFLG